MLVTSIFSFFHNVFKRLLSQGGCESELLMSQKKISIYYIKIIPEKLWEYVKSGLVYGNLSFSHNVLKRILIQGCYNQWLDGESPEKCLNHTLLQVEYEFLTLDPTVPTSNTSGEKKLLKT